MGTTGSLDVNLTPFSHALDHGMTTAAVVTDGIEAQGQTIGIALGITIAVGLLVLLLFAVLAIIPRLISRVKGIRRA